MSQALGSYREVFTTPRLVLAEVHILSRLCPTRGVCADGNTIESLLSHSPYALGAQALAVHPGRDSRPGRRRQSLGLNMTPWGLMRVRLDERHQRAVLPVCHWMGWPPIMR